MIDLIGGGSCGSCLALSRATWHAEPPSSPFGWSWSARIRDGAVEVLIGALRRFAVFALSVCCRVLV